MLYLSQHLVPLPLCTLSQVRSTQHEVRPFEMSMKNVIPMLIFVANEIDVPLPHEVGRPSHAARGRTVPVIARVQPVLEHPR